MGGKLLLADDSITIQKVIGIILANEDYELTVVDNGIAALEKARALHPDVMLVDALMPGKTGYEVCEEVRRDPQLAATPLLLLTGAFEPFDEEKARQCGADDFIAKPFESQQLIEKIAQVVAAGAGRAQAAPAAVAAPVAQAAPAAVAPAPAAAKAEDDFGDIFAPPAEPAVEAEAFAEAAVFAEAEGVAVAEEVAEEGEEFVFDAEEIVEVSAEEDPWGAMVEAEEVTEAEAVAEGEMVDAFAFAEAEPVAAAPVADVFAAVEAEPADVFAEAEPEMADVFAAPVDEAEEAFVATAEPEDVFAAPVAEAEEFSFAEEEVPVEAELISESEEHLGLQEAFAPVGEVANIFAEPVAEAAPVVAPAAAPVAAVAPVAAPAAAPAVYSGEVTISEAQLAEAVSRISKELIERIAWEVVPDLAEVLIKQELQKIKQTSA